MIDEKNIIDPSIFHSFVGFDPVRGRFDLRPGAQSPAARGGAGEDAPKLDIEGRPRVPPVDIGAYGR